MDEKAFDQKRRNLLVTTFILIFLKYANADVQSFPAAHVVRVVIHNPVAVLHAIWFLWAYFFLRAYQHFRYHSILIYKNELQRIVAPILHPYLSGLGIPEEHESVFFEQLERFHRYELVFRPFHLPTCWWSPLKKRQRLSRMRRSPLHWHKNHIGINLLMYKRIRYSEVLLPPLPRAFWKVRVWTISERSPENSSKLPIDIGAEVSLTFFQGSIAYVRILWRLIFQSAPFFEYRLPFIFALSPIP